MDDQWDEIGYVLSSRYRVAVLRRLAEGPAIPSQIASDTDLNISHISRALQGLRERSLVSLLVSEDRRKGRVYGITEKGEEVWGQIEEQDLE
jgi:DNA-binding MarR family transcriptional regulator